MTSTDIEHSKKQRPSQAALHTYWVEALELIKPIVVTQLLSLVQWGQRFSLPCKDDNYFCSPIFISSFLTIFSGLKSPNHKNSVLYCYHGVLSLTNCRLECIYIYIYTYVDIVCTNRFWCRNINNRTYALLYYLKLILGYQLTVILIGFCRKLLLGGLVLPAKLF